MTLDGFFDGAKSWELDWLHSYFGKEQVYNGWAVREDSKS